MSNTIRTIRWGIMGTARIAEKVGAAIHKANGAELAAVASNQIGAALQVAGQLEGAAGQALALASKNAFIDGTSTVYIIGGIVALVGTVLVWRFMPAYDLAPGTDEESVEAGVLTGDLATETVQIDQ